MEPISTGRPTPRRHHASAFKTDMILYRDPDEAAAPIHKYNRFLEKKYQPERLSDWAITEPSTFDSSNCVTLAPFELSPASDVVQRRRIADAGHNLNTQPALIRLFSHAEISINVLEHLLHYDLLNLACTNSRLQDLIRGSFQLWSITESNFENWDLTPEQFNKVVEAGEHCDGRTYQYVRNSRLTVTAVRGNPIPTFRDSLGAMITCFRALHHARESIHVLHFHNCPFLDLETVRLVLSDGSLPYLKALGIFHCRLLHGFHAVELMDILEARRPRTRVSSFDFAPNYHLGPDDINRDGSFGVSWTDLGVDTNKAIISYVFFQVLPKADRLNYDFFTKSSAYRCWLEKLPLTDWLVPRLLEWYAIVGSHQLQQFSDPWSPPTKRTMASQARHKKAVSRTLFEIMSHDEPVPVGATDWNRLFRWIPCPTCHVCYPRFLVRGPRYRCSSCCLRKSLCKEIDHYKAHRRAITKAAFDAWQDPKWVLGEVAAATINCPIFANPGRHPNTPSVPHEDSKGNGTDGDDNGLAFDDTRKLTVQISFMHAVLIAEDLDIIRSTHLAGLDTTHANPMLRLNQPFQNIPNMGGFDWLGPRCPQAPNPYKNVKQDSEPIQHKRGSSQRNAAAYYCPAANWDVKHKRRKPVLSSGSLLVQEGTGEVGLPHSIS